MPEKSEKNPHPVYQAPTAETPLPDETILRSSLPKKVLRWLTFRKDLDNRAEEAMRSAFLPTEVRDMLNAAGSEQQLGQIATNSDDAPAAPSKVGLPVRQPGHALMQSQLRENVAIADGSFVPPTIYMRIGTIAQPWPTRRGLLPVGRRARSALVDEQSLPMTEPLPAQPQIATADAGPAAPEAVTGDQPAAPLHRGTGSYQIPRDLVLDTRQQPLAPGESA